MSEREQLVVETVNKKIPTEELVNMVQLFKMSSDVRFLNYDEVGVSIVDAIKKIKKSNLPENIRLVASKTEEDIETLQAQDGKIATGRNEIVLELKRALLEYLQLQKDEQRKRIKMINDCLSVLTAGSVKTLTSLGEDGPFYKTLDAIRDCDSLPLEIRNFAADFFNGFFDESSLDKVPNLEYTERREELILKLQTILAQETIKLKDLGSENISTVLES